MGIGHAKPIDSHIALSAAQRFATAQWLMERELPELAYTAQNEAFYIFNVGEHNFVIIAGDDAYRPIIGYSDESTFDAANIPPALNDYFSGIIEAVSRLRTRGNAVATPLVAAEWESVLKHGQLISRNGGRKVDFLCQTKWNQDYPYNYCCPEDPAGSGGHTYVGCLATAMAQLMRYWCYPTQGIGNHCYTHETYGEICADFANTFYDWDNMPYVLNNSSTEAEKLATGTLGFHCGVTIDMGYGPDGSGGGSSPIVTAMPTYFNYCDNIQFYSRNDYETEEWKTMVREQFDMGWPMYYGGCEDDGCHAFVCDGYDDYDMFHFNLGWGGSSNGWYLIDEAPYTHPADAMFNFVPAEVYNQTPSAPTEFTAEPVSDTDLKVTLHWTNPMATLNGTNISDIEQVVVLRDNEIIQTLTDVTPGQTIEIVDNDVPRYDIYHYAVYVVANGKHGKHANMPNVAVGPSCAWQLIMTSSAFQGWRGGYISVYNATGHELSRCSIDSSVPSMAEPVLPLGQVSFGWTAPTETVSSMSFIIKDSQGNTVYSFSGSSDDLTSGIFLETNNTCGGNLSCGTPKNLVASATEEGILLSWEGVENQGYGYNLYRDGLLYRLIPASTSFLDDKLSLGGHCYRVTVLCEGGENGEFSNESCASFGPCYPPRNLYYETTSQYKIKLTWQTPQPNDGLSGYYLFRRQGEDGEYVRIKLLGATAVSYTDNALNTEGDYYYRLYAYYGDLDCTSAPANPRYATNAFDLHVYYSPTTIDENKTQLKIYPNPTKGIVTIQGEGLTWISVYNTLGQCVLWKELTNSNTMLDLQNLPQGLYLLRITTTSGERIERIAVMK